MALDRRLARAAPADIAAAVSAPKAPAKLAAYLVAKQGSRSTAEPDALRVGPSSAADLVADLRHFLRDVRTLMGYQHTDSGDAPALTR